MGTLAVCDNSVGDGSAAGSSVGDGSAVCDSSVRDLLFAVGDGNHSLASAKAHWENVKAELMKTQQANETSGHQDINTPAGLNTSCFLSRNTLQDMLWSR